MPWHRQILSRCLVFKKFVIASFCGEGVALSHERNRQRNLFRKLFKQIKLCMEVINYDDSWRDNACFTLRLFMFWHMAIAFVMKPESYNILYLPYNCGRFFLVFSNQLFFFVAKIHFLFVSALLGEDANCFTNVAIVLRVFLNARPHKLHI